MTVTIVSTLVKRQSKAQSSGEERYRGRCQIFRIVNSQRSSVDMHLTDFVTKKVSRSVNSWISSCKTAGT